ncbi:MAG: hypothetical protein OXC37_02640 [Bdellovibrionaceae bacterium]|nr:hypothetical protein [Pseudobdellovibrionaceae bacterium]
MKRISIKPIVALASLFILIAFCYAYPRFLAFKLGENSPWISYLYTYGMGVIVFVSSLVFIFTRQIEPLRKKQELYWLIALVYGLFFMFFLHGFWIYSAIHLPIKF